jgi:hypothetical protein
MISYTGGGMHHVPHFVYDNTLETAFADFNQMIEANRLGEPSYHPGTNPGMFGAGSLFFAKQRGGHNFVSNATKKLYSVNYGD